MIERQWERKRGEGKFNYAGSWLFMSCLIEGLPNHIRDR